MGSLHGPGLGWGVPWPAKENSGCVFWHAQIFQVYFYRVLHL